MIDSEALLARLLEYYSKDYDLTAPYEINDTIYDTYAVYRHFNCFEHAFIRSTLTLSRGDIIRFQKNLTTYIEPSLVRLGNDFPNPGHMYTYVTGLFISERRVRDEVRRMIRHFRYHRGYGFFNRGYCQARIAAFDTETGSLICSPAARDLMLEYQRILK
ncbi:MAG TPA: hypothetical protein H9672_02890 [Firmicutes bacterium]|nr:hypothetical protein [Bacillota bacterium]